MINEIRSHNFLSRLCGGEFINALRHCQAKFLSRLCGGEFNNYVYDLSLDFLSRLCGGEYVNISGGLGTQVSKPPVWR